MDKQLNKAYIKQKVRNLNHANSRTYIDKKIWEQVIFVDLHKFLLAFHVCKCFITNCLIKS